MFMILKMFGALRTSEKSIKSGIDQMEHGELAYSLSSDSLEGVRKYNAERQKAAQNESVSEVKNEDCTEDGGTRGSMISNI